MGSGLQINGQSIPAQHIRELTVSAETARQSMRNNGFDEVLVHDEQQNKDYVIASTSMDLHALRSNHPATLTLDGRAVSLIDYDDEQTSAAQGAMQGVRNGWRDLADTTIGAVRTAVGSLGAGGSLAMIGTAVGGSAYYFMKSGSMQAAAEGSKGVMAAATRGLATGGLTTMKVIGIAALAGAAVVTVAGAIRGANDAVSTSHGQNFASISRISIPVGSGMARPADPGTQPPAPNQNPVVQPTNDPNAGGLNGDGGFGNLRLLRRLPVPERQERR